MISTFDSFHLTIAAPHGDHYPVTARTQAGHEVSEDLLLPLDDATLTAYQMALDYHTPIDESVVIAVGQLLYRTLFQGTIAEAFATARTHADQHKVALRIHLAIDTDTRLSAAAALPWELMATAAGRPLMLEHALVRTFPWNDPTPDLGIPPGERIRLAVTSALPAELANHPIAAEAEVAIIRAAITHSSRPIDLIPVPHLTRERLTDLLTNERPHIVHHIGHGSIQRGMGYLDIERDDQSRDRLSAREFSSMLHQSGVQLVVLNACHTGSAGESLLTSFAPIFITDRIPAAIGMQAAILNRTGHCFANAFYATLGTGGSIDQALIAARKAIHADGHEHGAWGFPTLYSRVPHGGLWQTQQADHTNSASLPTVIQNTIEPIHAHGSNILIGNQIQGDVYQLVELPEAALKASLAALEQEKMLARIRHAAQQVESDRLLTLRLQGFVGRVTELAAIREHIAAMRTTGGYVLIKAAAGEGKSSTIANLIQEAGIAATPHHFIALTTERVYQLGLLRAVVAQLILKHGLTVSYFPEESYPAMKAEFARILDELSKQGIHETIYLDGLDQLQPESDGSRDLSFLPPQPPPGMVIVLGSRPDETLKPLEILHRIDYDLPPLSEGDALVLWRSVQPGMAHSLLYDLYAALKGNALFVRLAADTMRDQSVLDATSLIRQIEQNPQNLFGITLDRIKGRSLADWRAIWKPLLALLLVTQEPLRLDVLGDLLGHEHDTIQDAVWVLGGLVSQGIDQRVLVHHLMFRDYLAASIFNQREVKHWHQMMANWCAIDLDAIWGDNSDNVEQARRIYARYHYITHLALAENWLTLWQVLDKGDYGKHKVRFDPSARLYTLDLDWGREGSIQSGQSVEEHIQNLPRLWKYSLFRISLSSRANQLPAPLFVLLAMIGRAQEALERIELCSLSIIQLEMWDSILNWCTPKQQIMILKRVKQVASTVNNLYGSTAHKTILRYYLTIGDLDQAIALATTIKDTHERIDALVPIIRAAITANNRTLARTVLDQTIVFVTNEIKWSRDNLLLSLVEVSLEIGDLDQAIALAAIIENTNGRINALVHIVRAAITTNKRTLARTILDQAIALATTIKDTHERIDALVSIVRAAIIANKRTLARTILDQAIALATTIEDTNVRIDALVHIVRAAITTNKRTLARTVLDQAIALATSEATRNRDSILPRLVEVSLEISDLDQVIALAATIENTNERINALVPIIRAAITANNRTLARTVLDQTIALAATMEDANERINALVHIVRAAIITNNLTTAHVILDQAIALATSESREDYNNTFLTLVQASITIGNLDQAIIFATTIKDTHKRIDTFVSIARAAIITNKRTLARTVLDQAIALATNEATRNRDSILPRLVEVSLEIDDLDQAIALATTIEDAKKRIYTFMSIVHAAITTNKRTLAHTIFNQVITFINTNETSNFDETYNDILNSVFTLENQDLVENVLNQIISVIHNTNDTFEHDNKLISIIKALINSRYAIKSLDIIKIINNEIYYLYALNFILDNDIFINDIDTAQRLLDEAINIHKNINYIDIQNAIINSNSGSIPNFMIILLGNSLPSLVKSSIINFLIKINQTDKAINFALSVNSSFMDTIMLKPFSEIKNFNIYLEQEKYFLKFIYLIQKICQFSEVESDIWDLANYIILLLSTHPWLGSRILETEKWVNEQLKRLG